LRRKAVGESRTDESRSGERSASEKAHKISKHSRFHGNKYP
jgi:hypothetical protein